MTLNMLIYDDTRFVEDILKLFLDILKYGNIFEDGRGEEGGMADNIVDEVGSIPP